MLKTAIKPFVWLGILILVVGLACGLGGGDPTSTPPLPPTDAPAPTNAPPPTLPPAPTNITLPTDPPPPTEAPADPPTEAPPPTEEPPSGPPIYYIEEFEGDNSDYTYFVFNGVDGGTDMLYTDDGKMVFDITTKDTWVYVTYDPWIYGDVVLGLSAENRGKNSQRVSLTCRMSDDGWFELNIGGDGLYEILVYDSLVSRYFNLGNGGSTSIKLGRDTNVYVAECIGDELNLYVNGDLIKSLTIPNDYRFLDEGTVGFAVSSFDSLPVLINIDWFGIEQP